MAETYCGKTCEACTQKEALACQGCKYGPGRKYGGDCEIAKCCTEHGHEACNTCAFGATCSIHNRRDAQPEKRLARLAEEQRRKEALDRNAPVLGKWIWYLFWILILVNIPGILEQNFMRNLAPGLYFAGRIASALCNVLYAFCLLKLANAYAGYRKAAVFGLISSAVVILIVLLSNTEEPAPWTLLLTIPTYVLSLICGYHEFYSHSSVLAGVDDQLSEQWIKLWRWNVRCIIGVIGSVLLLLILPILGVLLIAVAGIGGAVVAVTKLVYLYRAAKIFRAYSQEA